MCPYVPMWFKQNKLNKMKIKHLYLLLLVLIAVNQIISAKIIPLKLTCEYMENPSVVDISQPRLSWINIAGEGERGQKQTAYQIRVATSVKKLKSPDLWDSKKVLKTNRTGFNTMVKHCIATGMLVAGAGMG